MKNISQEDLNNEMKKREREEYYEDKLLELKMQKFLDNYLIENELSKYKNKLDQLNSEKESLIKEKETLSNKIEEIKEAKSNYENTIQDINKKINEAENKKKEIEKETVSQQQYLQKMGNEDNLLNFIIKNFSEEFKKEIFEICSKKVNEALKSNNPENTNNKKEEKNTNFNSENIDSKYTMVSGQRGQFISYPHQNMPIQPPNGPNLKKTNIGPMYFPQFNNNQCPMMYPMFMMPPNMSNPFVFFPMAMNQNTQLKQNKENTNENNKNK